MGIKGGHRCTHDHGFNDPAARDPAGRAPLQPQAGVRATVGADGNGAAAPAAEPAAASIIVTP
jgi:hypothetical protein